MDKRTSVLIADNSEEFCTTLSAALQRTDRFTVAGVANDGEQASLMLEERRPDILVLDLMLSKKDGLSLLKSISGWERRPAVVATSGFMTDYVASAAAGLSPENMAVWRIPCCFRAEIAAAASGLGASRRRITPW